MRTASNKQATAQSRTSATGLQQAHLAAIVEYTSDAIISEDLDGNVTSWNHGAEHMFGYTEAEMLGTPTSRLSPEARRGEEEDVFKRVIRGEPTPPFDSVRQAKNGSLLEVSVTLSPVRDFMGAVVGASKIIRDIGPIKAREHEIERLSRLYAALSQVNQAIVLTADRENLMQKICEVLVEYGGFAMAWIGWNNEAVSLLESVAQCGDRDDYLKSLCIHTDERPEGHGPAGNAFRTRSPYICNDIRTEPEGAPWRTEMLRRGLYALAAFPIRRRKKVCGVLSVYSTSRDFFQDREVALLVEASGDISFGLDNLLREEERRAADQRVLDEKRFSEVMIESMPGIVYFYDLSGSFLRWNKSFEEISGFAKDEIATMHPLDFFRPQDKPLVNERIAEVFTRGVAHIEAPFLCRDGSTIPLFFTGRRVDYNGRPCLVGVGIDISERARAELLLRESEAKLRALVEQAPLGIALLNSDTGEFLKVNTEYTQILGYTEEEMLQLTYQQVTHPEDLQEDVEQMSRLHAGQSATFRMEKRIIHKSGRIVWVNLTCVRLGEAAGEVPQHIAMVEDITERKKADALIAESERKYRELVELANSIILRWDSTGHITFLNEFGQRFFGYSAEEIIGCHVIGTIVPDSNADGIDLQALMANICANPGAFESNVNENIRRNGERVMIAWTNRILRDPMTDEIEILSIGTDITARIRAEEARSLSEARLRELNETLEQKVADRTAQLSEAVLRAEAADRIKSSFLATMSHELRTPLNSIIGFTGILLQGLAGPLNEEQDKQLSMVRGSARHLLTLINDVLDISKIEAGQLEIATENYEPEMAIINVISSVKLLAERKGLELRSDIDGPLGIAVGDERRFGQVLLNLLSNAIKFTDTGTVILRARIIEAQLFSKDARKCPALQVQVIDSGIGIREDDLITLFQPFRQLDSGLARNYEGTGLGLAICAKLVGLMGGEIRAESTVGEGSTFTFTLPCQPKDHP